MAISGYLLFALAAGAMLQIQFGINAQLAGWLGGSVRAALVSFVVGRRRRRARASLLTIQAGRRPQSDA